MKDRAAALVRDFLGSVEVPEGLATLLAAAADRLETYLAGDEQWQALALPCETAEACGGAPPDRLDPVIGCVLLLFLAADLLDDAADGDLATEPWCEAGWARVTNTGVLHVFLGLHAAQAAPADLAIGLAAEIAEAGYRMACGQHLDLSHFGPAPPSVEAYREAIAGKTGGSFRMQCRMGALAARARPAVVTALGEYGLALGCAMQLAGDLRELWWRPDASDLRNGRWTLPTIALWQAGWRGDLRVLAGAGPEAVRDLLDRHGAVTACEAEFERLLASAAQSLGQAGLPPETAETLAARTRVPLLPGRGANLAV